jgi:hypothetical protein
MVFRLYPSAARDLDCLPHGEAAMPCGAPCNLSRAGQRSRVAREFLHSRGFQNLSELEGGYSNWRQQGLPINAPEGNAMSSSRFNMSRFFG